MMLHLPMAPGAYVFLNEISARLLLDRQNENMYCLSLLQCLVKTSSSIICESHILDVFRQVLGSNSMLYFQITGMVSEKEEEKKW